MLSYEIAAERPRSPATGEDADEVRAEPDARRRVQRVVRQFMTFDLELQLPVYVNLVALKPPISRPALHSPTCLSCPCCPGQVLDGTAMTRRCPSLVMTSTMTWAGQHTAHLI